MSFAGRPSVVVFAVGVCVAGLCTAVTSTQDSKSAPLAKELVQTVIEQKTE